MPNGRAGDRDYYDVYSDEPVRLTAQYCPSWFLTRFDKSSPLLRSSIIGIRGYGVPCHRRS